MNRNQRKLIKVALTSTTCLAQIWVTFSHCQEARALLCVALSFTPAARKPVVTCICWQNTQALFWQQQQLQKVIRLECTGILALYSSRLLFFFAQSLRRYLKYFSKLLIHRSCFVDRCYESTHEH